MPISENIFLDDACSGVAAETFEDLDQIHDQIETFLTQHLPLCVNCLPGFADGSIKLKGEKALAVSLCKRLIAFAYDKDVLFTFFNEDPDVSKSNRTDDMSVLPHVGMAYLKVGTFYYNCEDQLYIIEAKRLPTPTRAGQGDRSREYVVSDWDARQSPKKRRTGGIERFKEGLHGGAFVRSAMIAFVQHETPANWLEQVNSWIAELSENAIPCHKAHWSKDDWLNPVATQPQGDGRKVLTEFLSRHARPNGKGAISIRHFWLVVIQ